MEKKKRIYEGLLKTLVSFYLVLKPIYLFPSGLPQISDFILVLLFILLLFKHEKKFSLDYNVKKKIKRVIPFILWVVLINTIWLIILQDFTLLRPITYYIFNYFSMVIIYKLYLVFGDSIYRHIATRISIGLIMQFILIILISGSSIRTTGLFNNPNQLGLYALITITILFFLKSEFGKYKYLFYIAVLCAVCMIFFSLSKAAIISLIVFFLLTFILNNRNKILKCAVVMTVVLIVASGLGGFIYDKISEIPIIKAATIKIEKITEENDSDLGTGRGYDRLKESKYNIIEGVGEGGFDRFDTLKGLEIHSAYASILCYYGVIGFVLLSMFIIGALGKKYNNYSLISGILLFGITHQIWRNTLIWVLIVLIILFNHKRTQTEQNNNTPRRFYQYGQKEQLNK